MPPPRLILRLVRAALPLLRPCAVVFAVVFGVAARPGTAADDDDARPRAAPPALREAAPEIFYLEDDAGRLVPVPGFRYRDFVDLLRIKEGLPGLPEAPPAVLEQVVVTIDASRSPRAAAPEAGKDAAPEGARAPLAPGGSTCPTTVELSVRQSRAGWVNLPVDLSGLLLSGPPRYEGPGRILLTAAAAPDAGADQSGGYRLWLSGSAGGTAGDARHTIALSGFVALEATARLETVALGLPRATASRVEIRSWRDDPVVTVRPPGLPPTIGPGDDGGSSIALVGLSGPVTIDIGGAAPRVDEAGTLPPTSSSAAVPQASVESLVRVDGRVAVTNAIIRLEQLPVDTATIRVRLPPRAALRGVRPPATLVLQEDAAAGGAALIRVDRAADGRALVDLECERAVDPTGRETFDPLGFSVAGIEPWRQWGRASIVVEGDWQVEWDDLGDNRRVDAAPGGRPPGFVAAFAYDSQPAALPMRVRPRGSRLVIEPEYRYEVSAARIALDARLRISVRGAPVPRIVVMLDGWDVDEVGPPGLVDAASVTTEGRRLVIPFVQPLSGDAVVEIRGGRSVDRDAGRLGWDVPVPQADLLGPATVVIASQSDIEILPDAAGLRGLVRQVTPASLRPDADRFTLAYRLDGGPGRFEAARRFLPRRVDATIAAQADVDAADTVVRETIRFDVAHVPMEFVTLAVPREVVRAGTLEVRQNGQLLNPVAEPEDAPAPPADTVTAAAAATADAGPRPPVDAVPMRALLAVPLLGTGEVVVQFELPTPPLKLETTLQYDLPLVVPAGARLGRQSVALDASDMLSVEPRGEEWKRDVTAQGSVAGRIWTASRPQDRLPLALSTRRQTPLGQTVVDAAWLQTRLIAERREDVYTYAVTSSAEALALALPAGLTAAPLPASVDVRLDGETQVGAVRTDGRVVIELPRRAGAGSWLVEVVVARARGGLSELFGTTARLPAVVDLDAPRFPDGTLERRFYWELLLDPDEHPLGGPGHWTSQQQWAWGALGLERVPVVSRDVLRTWVTAAAGAGAGRDAEPPDWREAARLPADMPTPGSRAVYSGVGPPGSARVWIVPTWLLVLAVSGPVLAVGLAVVQRPGLRSPPLLLGAAAVASLAAAAVPDFAPLLAQAAVPGALLAVLAAGLRLVVNRGAAPAGRSPAVLVSATSITQAAPSLIVSPSAPSSGEETPATGRSLP